MGNYEISYVYMYNWIENMKYFILEDVVYMFVYEWINYYVVCENVLIFGLVYYNLFIVFEWIKEIVEFIEDIEYIVVVSYDGLIGVKYGEMLE